ncbi:MAG: hypothetical protein K2X04_12175 [Burkholderiales bacterium]|nr:hypothetical protein [Burkholderiales bacterium]
MNDLKEDITDTINNAKDTMTDYGNKISEEVVGLKDKVVGATDKCTNYMQDNPWKSVSISLIVGFILSRVLKS